MNTNTPETLVSKAFSLLSVYLWKKSKIKDDGSSLKSSYHRPKGRQPFQPNPIQFQHAFICHYTYSFVRLWKSQRIRRFEFFVINWSFLLKGNNCFGCVNQYHFNLVWINQSWNYPFLYCIFWGRYIFVKRQKSSVGFSLMGLTFT